MPPRGRRAGGGPGSYCGGASLPDRARDTHTDEIVALKKVRMDKEKDGELGGAAAPLALKWEGLGRCKLPELPEWRLHDGQRRLYLFFIVEKQVHFASQDDPSFYSEIPT